LPPGVLDPSVVDWVEPEFVHQAHHDLFGALVVARYWQGNAPRSSLGAPVLQQTPIVHRIERFDHGPAKLSRHPPALGHAVLDAPDPPIPLWIVIAGIHDNDVVRDASEQILRQLWDLSFRDGDDDQLAGPRRIAGRYGFRASLPCQVGQCLRASCIGY